MYHRGISWAQLQRASGVATRTLQQWARNGRRPDVGPVELPDTAIGAIAEVLRIKPDAARSLPALKVSLILRRRDDDATPTPA